jgi:hypothetical protein
MGGYREKSGEVGLNWQARSWTDAAEGRSICTAVTPRVSQDTLPRTRDVGSCQLGEGKGGGKSRERVGCVVRGIWECGEEEPD